MLSVTTSSPMNSSSTKTTHAPRRYSSNKMGQYAVNAITGEKYPYRIGSYDTLRLFRVQDTTSTYNTDGKIIKPSERNVLHSREPKYLYYDGPKEYMDHNHVTVDNKYIEKWKDFQHNLLDDKGKVKPSVYKEYLKVRNIID